MAENKNTNQELDQVLGQFGKLEGFIKNNTQLLYGILAVIVLGIAGLYFYTDKAKLDELDAQKELYTAQYFFEKDSIDLVLKGDGNNVTGVEKIAEGYSSTSAGNLAKFYTGVLYMKKGEFELAIDYLEDFSSSDLLIQARAYSLIGDANMEMESYEEAVSYYKKASSTYPNEFFTPTYLVKLALAYEKLDDVAHVTETYDEILSEYPNSAEANNAKKYKALIAKSI